MIQELPHTVTIGAKSLSAHYGLPKSFVFSKSNPKNFVTQKEFAKKRDEMLKKQSRVSRFSGGASII